MASNSNNGSGGWKPNQQILNNSGSGYWTSNSGQRQSTVDSSSGSWALNSGQSKSDSQAPGGWANSSGWASNAGKSRASSGGWQNKSDQSTSSTHQDENPINWDGLVEDVFKKEIGQMAEDLKETKPAWK